MNKKYEFTDEVREVDGCRLHRIKALREFGDVEAGQLGGYIEYESNLSHAGNCWVSGEACVYGKALVCDNAWVYGRAMVFGHARIYENAWIRGNSQVYAAAEVYGKAQVHGDARVFGDARIYGNAEVHGDSQIYEKACIFENAEVNGDSRIHGDSHVCGDAGVWGDLWGNTKLDHGIWNTIIEIDGKCYLISTTLRKVLLE